MENKNKECTDMKDTNKFSSGYYHPEGCNLSDLKIIEQTLAIGSVPNHQKYKKIFLFITLKAKRNTAKF